MELLVSEDLRVERKRSGRLAAEKEKEALEQNLTRLQQVCEKEQAAVRSVQGGAERSKAEYRKQLQSLQMTGAQQHTAAQIAREEAIAANRRHLEAAARAIAAERELQRSEERVEFLRKLRYQQQKRIAAEREELQRQGAAAVAEVE